MCIRDSLTSNIDGLLPTIRSRCVRLDLKVVDDGLIKEYLMEHLHIPDYQAEIDVSFAHGSIGKAKEAATSQEFADMTQNALKLLKDVYKRQVYIQRGYENFEEKLRSLGAEIEKVSNEKEILKFRLRVG